MALGAPAVVSQAFADVDPAAPVAIAAYPFTSSPVHGGSGTAEANAAVAAECSPGADAQGFQWFSLPVGNQLVYARAAGTYNDEKLVRPSDIAAAFVDADSGAVIQCSANDAGTNVGPLQLTPNKHVNLVGYSRGQGGVSSIYVDVTLGVPTNATQATAKTINSLPYTDTVDTAFAQGAGWVHPFTFGYGMAHIAYWRYTPSVSGPIGVSASSSFGAIAKIARVLPNGAVQENEDDCNYTDCPTGVSNDLVAGTTYLIGVGMEGPDAYTRPEASFVFLGGPVTLSVSGPSPAPPTTVKTVAAADTYANKGAPATNYGLSSSLASQGPGLTTYLRFVLPQAPAGKSLTGASLRISTTTLASAGSTDTHAVRVASDTWSEGGATWLNRAAVGSFAIGSLLGGTSPNSTYMVPLDVTSLRPLVGIQATLALTSGGTDALWFWSSNYANAAKRPQLVLTYE